MYGGDRCTSSPEFQKWLDETISTETALQPYTEESSRVKCDSSITGCVNKGCANYKQGEEYLVESGGEYVCKDCGWSTGCRVLLDEFDYDRDIKEATYYNKHNLNSKLFAKTGPFAIRKNVICYGMSGIDEFRRYKRECYYRERLAQWTCTEPLNEGIVRYIKQIADTGLYGWKKQFTRATIMRICKDYKLCKYKENWKHILYAVCERPYPPMPDCELLEFCMTKFKLISDKFDKIPASEMALYLKGTKGKNRHHIIHVNYVHRKILEIRDIYTWHDEFPLLRTPLKIKALDDVMEIIMKQLNLPFHRTSLLQIPKCRVRFRNKQPKRFILFYA